MARCTTDMGVRIAYVPSRRNQHNLAQRTGDTEACGAGRDAPRRSARGPGAVIAQASGWCRMVELWGDGTHTCR